MKIINKLSILVLLCSVMVACTNKGKVKPEETTKEPVKVVEQTPEVVTNPFGSVNHNGKDMSLACCSPEHLNDTNNLLSQRVIYFSYDQATVESNYRDLIAIHAKYLSANPSAKMVLEGHADERGTPEYNLALGEKRGNSVANLLKAQGASSAQVSVVSFGEEKPVFLCNDDSCWSQNRRVRIVYTSK